MKYTTLGNSGAVVSRLALGTMTFGGATTEDEAFAQLELYSAAGGTFVETADVYTAGVAEEIVGRWLAQLGPEDRSRVFLASKGRFPVGVDPRDAGLSRRHLRRALDASLARLGVEHIDLYQLHAWDPLSPVEESIGFLDDAVRAGKISYGGLSNFIGWQIAKAAAAAQGRVQIISNQPQYNLLVREPEWEIIPASLDAGIGVLPWSPLAGGWLTGKYARHTPPTGTTRLGENPDATGVEAYFRRSNTERTWLVLDALRDVASQHDSSTGSVAIAWLLRRPGVASVILGARTSAQLGENLQSIHLELDDAHLETLDRVSDPDPADYPYGQAGLDQRSRSIIT